MKEASENEYDSDCIVVADKIQQRSSSPKPLKYVPNPFSTTYKEIYLSKKSFFTKSERKELKEYNANTFNPNKGKEAQQQYPKRMVIIDGSNVAFSYARQREFSVKDLKICIEYFKKLG